MPAPLLLALCVTTLFVTAVTGFVPAVSIENDTLRHIVAPTGWLAGIGVAIGLQMYGYSLHPEWWNEGFMPLVVLLAVIGNLATFVGTIIYTFEDID